MAGPSSPGQEGPDDIPPRLPEGWLAQWDGQSRKYYYVQRATGHSQWEVPTKPALSAPTPEPTPQGVDPFGKPIDTQPAPDAEYAGQDRSLLGDLAMSALGGGKQGGHSSGLGSLAHNLLGGHGKTSNSQTPTNLGGQLLGSILGAGKTHSQSGASSGLQNHAGQSNSSMQSAGSLVGGLLHGHHGQSQQGTNYGYNAGQATSGAYSGQAPPLNYSPAGSPGSFGPSSGPYHPLGTHKYNSGSQEQTSSSLASQTVKPNQPSSPYQSQTTPQPYGITHSNQGQNFQSTSSGNQFQTSNPSTSTYGQHASPFLAQTSTSSGYSQYDNQHGPQSQNPYSYPRPTDQQGMAPSFPPPPGQGQGANFPAQNFPTNPSGQTQSYYSQQQQQQQPGFQHGGSQNFPPPPPQAPPSATNHFGQQNMPLGGGYPTPSGSQPSLSSQQVSSHLPGQGFNNSPAPPMHSHPSGHGYSGTSNHQQMTGYSPHGQNPSNLAGQSTEPYGGNYEAPPPAPSWR